MGRIAAAIVSSLSAELEDLLSRYSSFKRAAALLDFDDLLEMARNLVRSNDVVRRALGARYRHIFVDEFQDTDPIQSEILFLIASDHRALRWQDSELRPGALFLVGDPKQAHTAMPKNGLASHKYLCMLACGVLVATVCCRSAIGCGYSLARYRGERKAMRCDLKYCLGADRLALNRMSPDVHQSPRAV